MICQFEASDDANCCVDDQTGHREIGVRIRARFEMFRRGSQGYGLLVLRALSRSTWRMGNFAHTQFNVYGNVRANIPVSLTNALARS